MDSITLARIKAQEQLVRSIDKQNRCNNAAIDSTNYLAESRRTSLASGGMAKCLSNKLCSNYSTKTKSGTAKARGGIPSLTQGSKSQVQGE